MEKTSLTIGGFTQPTVGSLLNEKGLSTRFLWIFPKPSYANFSTLEPVNDKFTSDLGMLHCNNTNNK